MGCVCSFWQSGHGQSEFGSGPGQINCAHNCAYAEGKLVVCDRNNSRFHVFDAETTDLLETW